MAKYRAVETALDMAVEQTRTLKEAMERKQSKENSKKVFKYNEDKSLDDAKAYIATTYSAHYVGQNGVQLMDLFYSNPQDAEIFCKTNAMKYIHRYGKKGGHNLNDLHKAIHYITMLIHNTEASK